MAKKRAEPSPPPPAEPGPRRTVLTIKGTEAWRGWLEGLSRYTRTPTSTIVDHALVKFAKEAGYAVEAPER